MKNILITGATGFIGKELIKKLSINKDYCIYRVVRKKKDKIDKRDVFIDSIDGETEWGNSFNNIDVIIHLAAKVHDMKFKEDNNEENDFYKINAEGTRKLVEEAGKSGVKKIVFLSTIKVNGENNENIVFSEDSISNPKDSYGKSKLKAENYIIDNSSNYGYKYTIIRPTLVFGAGAKGNLELLMKFVSKIIIFPYFKNENKRSMIGIKNLCDLIENSIISSKFENQVLIAMEKNMISTKDLIEKISISMKKKIFFIKIPSFLEYIIIRTPFLKKIMIRLYGNLIVNNEKLYKRLDWKPKYTVDEQIDEMVKEFIENINRRK